MTSETARRRFAEQVLPHLDDAYSLARWLTGDATDAEDVAQDACIRALAALERGPADNPRAFLLTITRNAAFTWLAKNRPRALVLVGDDEPAPDSAAADPPAPTPEEVLIAAADRVAVVAAIESLPLVFKETLVMREINELSYREIAEATGVRLGTVMSRLARARAMLVDRLGRKP